MQSLFLSGVAALFSSGIIFAATVTYTDLGVGLIKLEQQQYDDDSYVVIEVSAAKIRKNRKNESAVGDNSPGLEAEASLPKIQTSLVKKNYRYEFKIREASANSWQTGDRFKVDVYSDDGSSVTLRGTLYLKQDTVDDGDVEGVKVRIDTGYSNQIDDVWSILITRE